MLLEFKLLSQYKYLVHTTDTSKPMFVFPPFIDYIPRLLDAKT